MAMSILFAILLICLANGLTLMPPTTKTAEHLPLAHLAMDYFDKSSDPFHAVQTSIDLLEKAGFEELDDVGAYKGKIQPGGKYYFTRNKSTLGKLVARRYREIGSFSFIQCLFFSGICGWR